VPPVSSPGKTEETQVQPAGKPLTNDNIIALVKAGLSDDVIVLAIQKSPTQFDLSPEALIKLKEAGISNTVTETMMGRRGPLTAESSQQSSTQGTVNMLREAIAANNYAAFIANAAPALKTKITKEAFTQVSTQLSPRLKKGYELQYNGSLKQQGVEVFVWKISYKDAGNEMLVRLVLQDNKVAGFWLQ
jgi:hypothetical protein